MDNLSTHPASWRSPFWGCRSEKKSGLTELSPGVIPSEHPHMHTHRMSPQSKAIDLAVAGGVQPHLRCRTSRRGRCHCRRGRTLAHPPAGSPPSPATGCCSHGTSLTGSSSPTPHRTPGTSREKWQERPSHLAFRADSHSMQKPALCPLTPAVQHFDCFTAEL